jgi:hypothetical protein
MLARRFLSHNYLRTLIRVSRAQALIVSFPKSGRTWLRLMLGKALCTRFGMPDWKALAIDELSSRAGLLRTYVTHDGAAIEDGYTYRQLPVGKQRYAKRRIVLMTRDPKDVLVSSYFHATRRARLYSGNISTFVRDDRYGARKLVRFHQIWSEHAHVPAAFMLVRYEDLKTRPEAVLTGVLEYIGLPTMDQDILGQAVRFASFSNMRTLEQSGRFSEAVLRPRQIDDEESYKVRRGIVGGYRAYLGEDEVRYVNDIVEEGGRPFERVPSLTMWPTSDGIVPAVTRASAEGS